MRTRAAASRLAQAINTALERAVESLHPTRPPYVDPKTKENLQETFRIATGFALKERHGRFYAAPHTDQGDQQ